MATILPENQINQELNSSVHQFFREQKLGTLLNQSNIRKEAGISPVLLVQFIFSLVLQKKNLYRTLESGREPEAPAKDAVYRLLNNATYNWRKFLLLLSRNVITQKLLPLVSENRERVLILDDSLYSRARSKSVEMLALVHDHTTKKFVRGFRMLTLGWSDGNTFLPLAFSLLSSEKQSNRFQEINPAIDKRTVGYKRRKEAVKKSTEALFDLLDDINPLQLCARTLLFDSWFAFPKVIKRVVSEYPLEVVCMLKRMHRVYYTYEGQKLCAKNVVVPRSSHLLSSAWDWTIMKKTFRLVLSSCVTETAPKIGLQSCPQIRTCLKKKLFVSTANAGILSVSSRWQNHIWR